MKSAKTIVIVGSVVILAVCLRAYSSERDDSAPSKVVPTPTRAAQTPAKPAPILEEEAPIPKPVTRTPTRTTPARTPVRRPTTPSRIKDRLSTIGKVIRPAEDPYKDSVILVEAFMVEVQLSALHSQGVPEISEGCKSISAEQIIKLMKTTDAAVLTAGAKVAVCQKDKARTESITHLGRQIGTTEKRRIEYVGVGTTFTAIAEIRDKEKIFVELDFEHSDVQQANPAAMGTNLVKNNWSSSLCLKEGKPTLVGSTADKETGTFLIVTANIKD